MVEVAKIELASESILIRATTCLANDQSAKTI